MAVMATGVREAGIDRAVVADIRFVSGIGGLFDGKAVDVDADGGDRTRTARVQNGHGARIAAEGFEEVGGNTVFQSAFLGLFNKFGVAAHDGGGFDDVDAGLPFKTEFLEAIDNVPSGLELTPAFFGMRMEKAAVRNHLFSEFFHDNLLFFSKAQR